ncbi:MAG: hypothetical protein ACRDV8_12025, partial [Acidimicrobiales bacterium]
TTPRPSAPGATDGAGIGAKLSRLVLKPPDPTRRDHVTAEPRTVEELENAARFADDKERLIGLLAAPVAAAIALLVYGALVANDPTAHLRDGLASSKHVPQSLYGDLVGVLVVLAVAMLAAAWFRKRLFLGCAMALYGLAIFNLHYWGFGVPYVLFGAWLLVRAYRAQRDFREAEGSKASRRGGGVAALAAMPPRSKRYTPPSSSRRRV